MESNEEENGINLSLDEYIKRKNIDGQFCFLNMRRKLKFDDKEALDKSLDEIVQQQLPKNCCGKFDRFSDKLTDDEDEENGNSEINNDTDVDMAEVDNPSIRFAQEIQRMDHPDCCNIKERFKTVESELGVKVRSQQWRMQKENLERKEGVPRLVPLPLTDEERYRKVQNGRIHKNIRRPKSGTFVEKGNFTYKFDDNEDESVVGIVRNKPNMKIITGNRYNNTNNRQQQWRNRQQQPININMNWNGFFQGMTKCIDVVQKVTPTAPAPQLSSPSSYQQQYIRDANLETPPNDDLKIAAKAFYDFLVVKRENERSSNVSDNINNIDYFNDLT